MLESQPKPARLGRMPLSSAVIDRLQRDVWQANLDLVREGLVVQTFGNASGIDRARGLVAIKPSGVAYDRLKPSDMVVVALDSGRVVEGRLRPSSDTPTHLVLYREFSGLGGIVHTHSLYATAWAQSRRDLPPLGTTHADSAPGPIPCTRLMRLAEIQAEYEAHTGAVIVERFRGEDPLDYPGVLVASHGPFAWGASVREAVRNAAILEFLARLASETLRIEASVSSMQAELLNKHFSRKHGPTAYYGQIGAKRASGRKGHR
jgi:L-ribulose-5-phosphate 4-epimerase